MQSAMHQIRRVTGRLPVILHARLGHKLVTRELGEPLKVLELQKQERPKLSSADNVLLGVVAANINPSDLFGMQGLYPTRPKDLPAVFGLDGIAEVIEVGSNVKNVKLGDRVWPISRAGVYQTYIQCKASDTILVDKRLELLQAATMLANPTTAYFMIKMGNLQKGDTILQNAANSAVGQCVIQMARDQGFKTINIVRPRKDIDDVRKMLTQLGATAVITDDELKDDAAIKALLKRVGKPKLAFDAVGGNQVIRMSLMMESKGTFVSYGNMSKQPLMIPAQSFIFQDVRFVGFWLSLKGREEWNAAIRDLTEMSVSGKIQPPPCELRPATEWRTAFEIATGGTASNSAGVQHRPKQLLAFYDPKNPQ